MDGLTMTAYPPSRSRTSAALGAGLLVAAALAGGCASKGDTTASFAPDDVRERHPIVLKDAPRSLDVFVGRSGAALDPRQNQDVVAFAQEYRRSGRGGLVVRSRGHEGGELR